MSFSIFNLDPRIMVGVNALGYAVPTPIQQQSIPPILAGRDLMGLAQTGTGKTAAFLLPVLQKLLKEEAFGCVRVLILVPTRALAEQIFDVLNELGKGVLRGAEGRKDSLRSITLYGGVDIRPQLNKLRRGVDIVIACPGRLLDHVGRSSINLSEVSVLILDEADQMFDMGFLPNIRKILKQLPSPRQSLLFSATMPRDVHQLAEDILNNPMIVKVGSVQPANTVTQTLYPVSEHRKTALLHRLLQETSTESVLIFTRTKQRAKHLAHQLKALGYKADSFQGNLSQRQREITLTRFRKGALVILVATDIAARGIDIDRVSHVINFDMPATVEAYTHRIGRTGRANKNGYAFTLITRSDGPRIRLIERLIKQRLVQQYLPDFDYAVPSPPKQQAAEPHSPPPTRRPYSKVGSVRRDVNSSTKRGSRMQKQPFGSSGDQWLS